MTGFRATRTGRWGLDGAVEGWAPDLMTFGKVMGGGFPAAAFGGRADVMSHLAPEGGVYQAGTLSGNPVAATAGRDHPPAGHRRGLRPRRPRRDDGARGGLRGPAEAGVPHLVQADGTMFSVFFTDADDVTEIRDYAAAGRQRTDRFAAFFHSMLDQGVYLPPSAYEVWFLSSAHDDAALARIVDALPAAARAAAAVR